MREIDPSQGLHLLRHAFQKQFMETHCELLEGSLTEALAATVAAAPVRENPYIVTRTAPRTVQGREAQWEEALFWQWRDPAGRRAPWSRLVTYQVNLPNKKKDPDWGEIDLLGVSDAGLPVLVELKAENSSDSPAKMLVQAAAYGVVLRKAWPRCFRGEWESVAGPLPNGQPLPTELSEIQLVCAAPVEYWNEWTGETSRAGTVSGGAWAALARLRHALALQGFPAVFASLGHDGNDGNGLPDNITIREEALPDGQ